MPLCSRPFLLAAPRRPTLSVSPWNPLCNPPPLSTRCLVRLRGAAPLAHWGVHGNKTCASLGPARPVSGPNIGGHLRRKGQGLGAWGGPGSGSGTGFLWALAVKAPAGVPVDGENQRATLVPRERHRGPSGEARGSRGRGLRTRAASNTCGRLIVLQPEREDAGRTGWGQGWCFSQRGALVFGKSPSSTSRGSGFRKHHAPCVSPVLIRRAFLPGCPGHTSCPAVPLGALGRSPFSDSLVLHRGSERLMFCQRPAAGTPQPGWRSQFLGEGHGGALPPPRVQGTCCHTARRHVMRTRALWQRSWWCRVSSPEGSSLRPATPCPVGPATKGTISRPGCFSGVSGSRQGRGAGQVVQEDVVPGPGASSQPT